MVTDASVVLGALVDTGGFGALARESMTGADLHAPHLLDVEVASALRGRVLGGGLDPGLAQEALSDLGDLAVERHPHRWLLGRAFELRDNLTTYDAVYVALAEGLG
ncbi:MAG: type II toxin-antitoxin system VapC family toxin, partial [Actinomycetes bacterium]